MKKIVDYYTICKPFYLETSSDDNVRALNDLEGTVREAIKQGWQPFGGLSVGHVYSTGQYVQALVKYE